MTVKQDVLLKSSSTSIPLRIITGGEGNLIYEELTGDGADLLEPQDGVRFVEKFDTWHRGGFIPRYIQNGWYNDAINIDCLTPGELKPAARREKYITLNCTGNGLGQFGIAGMAYDEVNTDVLVVVRYEGAGGDNVPNRMRQFAFLGTTMIEDGAGWGSNQEITNQGGGTNVGDAVNHTDGFTNKARPIQLVRSSTREWLIPCGTEFNEVGFGAVGPRVALPAHDFAVGQGRIYKVSIDERGRIGISNVDINADYTNTGNWTTPVLLGAFDSLSSIGPSGITINILNGIPVVGTPDGLFVLGPGGIPDNLTPQFANLAAGQGNMSTLVGGAGGLIAGMAGRGRLLWITPAGGAPIGPDTNPLAEPPVVRIMDIIEAPTGDIWVLAYIKKLDWTRTNDIWTGELFENLVVWIGVKSPGATPGPGAFSWHPYIKLEGSDEMGAGGFKLGSGIGRLRCDTVMLPYIDTAGVPWVLIGGGSTTDVTKLIRIDGARFFGTHEGGEEHEAGSPASGISTEWTSGRYFRPSRNQCFYSRITLKGYGFGSSGVRGGTVDVNTRYDNGTFGNRGTMTNTTNDSPFEQSIVLNQVAFDIEWQLDWKLDGDAVAMAFEPAVVTGIEIEGKEIPDKVRIITMMVEGTAPRQAGGTRSHAIGTGLRDDLEALAYANTVNLTFTDPYKADRTVYLVDSLVVNTEEAERLSVPEGSITVRLVEVL